MPDCPHPGKTGYATRDMAEAKLARIWKQLLQPRHPRRTATPCRTYRCPGCSLWHLTARPLFPDQTQAHT